MIYLSSPVMKVKNIKCSTSMLVVKDTDIGDEVQFCIPLKRAGSGSRGTTRATHMTFANLTKRLKRVYTMNTFTSLFDVLELEEVHDDVELYMRRSP